MRAADLLQAGGGRGLPRVRAPSGEGQEAAGEEVKLAEKPKPRRSETTELVHPIRLALNKMPGVRVSRNNCGVLEWAPGKMLKYGLGDGSSDLVGIVQMPQFPVAIVTSFGRVFCLEIKRHAVRRAHADIRRYQERWRGAVKRLGGFAGLIEAKSTEDGIAKAIAAVDRCREGLSE